MSFCLPQFVADEMKRRIRSGEVTPDALRGMSSSERRAYFKTFMAEETAKRVNALYESKLLLKDQQRGIITWAKSVTGLKPSVRQDIVRRAERMTEAMDKMEYDDFLADLAEQKVGLGVTVSEAEKISKLSKELAEKKEKVSPDSPDRSPERLEMGRAHVALTNYVNELTLKAESLTLADFRTDPLRSSWSAIVELGGQSKSITASLDASAILNQGWKVMLTNPIIWARSARKTFSDIVQTIGGKEVMDELNADIVSRKNYDLMQRAKLAVGTTEEAFPSSLPERIYGVGRAFKASQEAYTAFVHRTRADIFDKTVEIARKSGVDVTDQAQLEAIGMMINSLTGRGTFGRLEGPAVDAANNLLFSPRFLKSQFDVLTHPIGVDLAGKRLTPFARKQAAINIVKVISGTAAILAMAQQIGKAFGHDDVVELDPRSADFGDIKIGNTRFALGGGLAPVITLAARMVDGRTKPISSGELKPLDGQAFGGQTREDVIFDFFTNRASPAAAFVRDWMRGEHFGGDKFTPVGGLVRMVTPFPVQTYMELSSDPNSANDLLGMIASSLGINIQNIEPQKN